MSHHHLLVSRSSRPFLRVAHNTRSKEYWDGGVHFDKRKCKSAGSKTYYYKHFTCIFMPHIRRAVFIRIKNERLSSLSILVEVSNSDGAAAGH
jgi:hypothetical protein